MREKNKKIQVKDKENMRGQIESHLCKSKGKNKKNMIDKKSQSYHIPNDLIFNILPRLPSPDYIIDLWALEEDNWIKKMSIPQPEVPFCQMCLKPVCLMKDGKKKFRELEIEDIDIGYAARLHPGITYTETLVSPFRLKKSLSDSGALAQRVLDTMRVLETMRVQETVRSKKHVCNIRTKCDHHPRVNWKQWQRQDRTKKKGYKKVAIT